MGIVIDFQKAKDSKPKQAMPNYLMVQEFNTKMNSSKDLELWKGLIKEEMEEAYEAAEHLLKELMDLQYVIIGAQQMGLEGLEVEAAEAIENVERFRKFFSEDQLNEAFKRVHESNMSKLWDDGKPHYRADGKVLKGPKYQVPYLLDLV